MGSHGVTCHPAEVTFSPLPQPKLVLDLATPEGCKAELTCKGVGVNLHVLLVAAAAATVTFTDAGLYVHNTEEDGVG